MIDRANNPSQVRCPLCGHDFHPGNAVGVVYCSRCGRRFNPYSALEDTVNIPPPNDNGGGNPGPASTARRQSRRDSGDHAGSGRRFGDYDLISEVARGGMGVVYMARQRILKRVVALKVLRSGDSASEEERERLLREAKAAAGLTHPNIVPIHDFSIHQGQPYFTMDFIEGQSLERLLEKGPLNTRQSMTIIEAVARAIDFAHSKGIIHRDLKPANIIIDRDGRPMVTDFGLAVDLSASDDQQRMTSAGSVMGTIPYIPPEQAGGKVDQITERSDVYAMGAVLYEMLTGRPPFSGFTQFELMRRVINQEPAAPRLLNPKVHRDAETIALKCLEKDPRRRYSGAKAFADDCQSFLKGEVIAARPATLGYRVRRFLARRPVIVILTLCAVLSGLAAWYALRRSHNLAVEKREAEAVLELTLAKAEEMAKEKAETDRLVRRDWRSEYNINFDYAFRWEADADRSRRADVPWLDVKRARLLAAPPRLALSGEIPEQGKPPPTPLEATAALGLPFSFPREVRVILRVQAPPEAVGDLVLLLDADRSYQAHVGTTIVRFGSSGHPGASFLRGEAMMKDDPTFAVKPGSIMELAIERADDRIRAFADGVAILDAEDPAPVSNSDAGRLALDVRGGSLEIFDLVVEVRGMSRNLVRSLLDTANTMSARGRGDLALRLYESLLLEPTDPTSRLKALRGYARSLWVGLPRNERGPNGIVKACAGLNDKLAPAGRVQPGEIDYLAGLALALNPLSNRERAMSLERLDRAAALAYSAGGEAGEYGDLARQEAAFVYVRLERLREAARLFTILFDDGTAKRLSDRYGPELGGGGQAALLLEKVDPLLKSEHELDVAETLLKATAYIAPGSRECAQRFRTLARIHAGNGSFETAIRLYREAQAMAPDWYRPYLDEAFLYFRSNNPNEAAAALEKAAKALPQSLDLQIALVRLFLDELPPEQQDAEKALKAARTAVNLSQRQHPGALDLEARALSRLGRKAEALAAVDDALALERSDQRLQLREEIAAMPAAGRDKTADKPK